MLFTSWLYALFLPTVVILFWVLPKRFRLPMLLAASYLFYMSWMPIFGALIFLLTAFNFGYGRLLAKSGAKRKAAFAAGVAVNLLVLCVFKYANFVLQTASGIWHLASHQAADWTVNIILPLGISFFVFEFIHYLFEIYRGNKPVDSFVLFALYAAFFPTQIAGPIKRYPDFVEQMQAERKLQLSYFDEGIPLIIVGLAKKLLLADTLSVFVQMGVTAAPAYGAIETWLFAFAFAFQIYFDFSGYTDIARGSAMLFGYHIPLNFNCPYIAANISEFWHRWHISLSSWLRDYLFIPLGGSKGSEWSTRRNLLLTMALGGLWHGASWNFMVWGTFHGLLLIAHREFTALKKRFKPVDNFVSSPIGHLLSVVSTFLLVCIGWVFFRVQDMRVALPIVWKMVTLHPLTTRLEAKHLLILDSHMPVVVPIAIIMVIALVATNLPLSWLNAKGSFKRAHPILKGAFCAVVLLCTVLMAPDDSHPFIYFQF